MNDGLGLIKFYASSREKVGLAYWKHETSVFLKPVSFLSQAI